MTEQPDTLGRILDFLTKAFPYLSTFFLSAWGGIVNRIIQVREGKAKFTFTDLFFDLIISTFVGLLTMLLCNMANTPQTLSAVLIAISGHMGTRAIRLFEVLWAKRLNLESPEETK